MTPVALRRTALAVLGPFADARARELLERATLDIEPDVAGWDGTPGHTRGHRVCLGVDGAGLGALRGHPAVADAVTAALAAALPPGEALVDVASRWAQRSPPPGCYRATTLPLPADRDAGDHLHEAAVAFLEAAGDDAAAEAVRHSTLTLAQGRAGQAVVTLHVGASHRAAVASALAALVAPRALHLR